MKKYFSTGLVILLPVLLTVVIIGFLIKFLTNPFLDSVSDVLGQFHFFQHTFFIFESDQMLIFVSRLIILSMLFFVILLMGWVGKFFFVNYFIQLGNRLIRNIPYVSKIYRPCQEVINGLLTTDIKSFAHVVLVPFPNTKAFSIGFVTKESILIPTSSSHMLSIFVPCTPNPSVGFMMMLKKEEVIFVNMKPDEAMKFILSCGVVTTDFTILKKDSE